METSNPGGGGSSVTAIPGRNKGNRASIAFGQQLQTSLNPAHNGGSWHFACMSECPYVAVRVVILNQESAGYTLNGMVVAPSTTINSPAPTGSFVNVTWGGATTKAIPARLAANRPSVTYSDWISVLGVQHSGGLYPIHTRTYIATGPFSYSGGSTTLAQWKESAANSLIRGRYTYQAVAAGDYVTTNTGGFVGAGYDDTISLTPVMWIEFLTQQNVITVYACGDSTMWGGTGTLDMVGAGHLACAAISTTSRPVCWHNASVPSTTTTQFVTRLQDDLSAGVRPQILVYQTFSRNDGTPTAATIQQNRVNLATVLDLCTQYGIVPILDTWGPETAAAWNATADNFRKGWLAEVKALASQGITIIDSDSVLSNGATPARFATGVSTDGTHPNDTGQALLAPLWQTAISSVASRFF